jgi:hypothetical protein
MDNYAVIECISKKFGIFKVLIDLEDVEKVEKYHWNVKASGKKKRDKFYVQSAEKGKTIHLHRYLLNLSPYTVKTCVDHINGNSLDNRKENLRVCTALENLQNKKNVKNGIKYNNNLKKWEVIKDKICIGSFKLLEQAKEFFNLNA